MPLLVTSIVNTWFRKIGIGRIICVAHLKCSLVTPHIYYSNTLHLLACGPMVHNVFVYIIISLLLSLHFIFSCSTLNL